MEKGMEMEIGVETIKRNGTEINKKIFNGNRNGNEKRTQLGMGIKRV